MTNLNQSLFRIDPAEGLLQYVQAVKPFRSKVLDVFVEYMYAEGLNVTLGDSMDLTATMSRPEFPMLYSGGYGFVWSPYDTDAPETLPTATIVSASSLITNVATFVPSTSTLTLTPDASEYVFTVNQPVVFSTSGTFPTASSPITAGKQFFVTSATSTTLQVATEIAGTPITFTGVGDGVLTVHPVLGTYNTFLVSLTAQPTYDIVVSDLVRNQFTLVTPFTITDVAPTLRQFLVSGNLVSGPHIVIPGDVIYVSGNTDTGANAGYTVQSVTVDGPLTTSTVVVEEFVSLTATVSGKFNVPLTVDEVPYWPAGSAITINSASTFPSPVVDDAVYYFTPTTAIGVFNLSSVRYPREFSDIIDITTLGGAGLTVERAEPFVPGEYVTVSGSFDGINDGQYVVGAIAPEGNNFRLMVLQHVSQTTPASLTTDGTMTYAGSYGDPYSIATSTPDLYTSTYFDERIVFEFGPSPLAAYLLDTFSGEGNLSTHTSDSGHTWNVFQLVDNLSELVLNGTGGCITADTDIWCRSNWVPSITGSFYTEAELFVKEHPGAGSPYFRLFAKESNLVDFYGPHVDVYPNSTTGKIAIQVWDGDELVGNIFTVDTSVNVNESIVVRLQVISNTQVRVYVNGVLLYTSAAIILPTLTFVGFNFRVPAGDPTQFVLNRILSNN